MGAWRLQGKPRTNISTAIDVSYSQILLETLISRGTTGKSAQPEALLLK
jgi:hypothetical protein